eukprot:Nitzschia sp. Nitz4//scaffold53_size117307//107044//107865//NITZ4_003783-RA/size117307-processed-gene-0.168-mRNA-1//-1//CDS//3329554244//5786//frame0
MSLWANIQKGAKKAGDATKLAAQKTKLRGDMLLIDRDIQNRVKAFGVAMYDHISPLSQNQDFYAAEDELTNIVRPPLIEAQKEIQALAAKRVQLKEQLAAAEAKRAGAFPDKAETMGQKFMNFGKASVMHSGETKIKAELAIVDTRIKGHKQKFGQELYGRFVEAEDKRGYLPSDRQVRNIYDTCRADIQRMETNKKAKREQLTALGATDEELNSAPEVETTTSSTSGGSQAPPAASFQAAANNAAPIPTTSGYTDTPTTSSNNNQPMEDLLL